MVTHHTDILILADIQTQVQVPFWIAARMHHHARKSLKFLQISIGMLTDVQQTNATNGVLTQLANGVHALSTHTGHMTSST